MSARVLRLDAAAHRVVDVLLPGYVGGTLDTDERALVEQHLEDCVQCRREVEWLRELRAACLAGETTPGASPVFGKLRRQLDEPHQRPRALARMRSRWDRLQPWARWAIAAELAVIVLLGAFVLPGGDGPALYRTLSSAHAPATAIGTLVVVFDPAITEAELRRIVRGAGARIVDGPTQTDGYVLELPAERQAAALEALRAQHAVVLAEQLRARSTR